MTATSWFAAPKQDIELPLTAAVSPLLLAAVDTNMLVILPGTTPTRTVSKRGPTSKGWLVLLVETYKRLLPSPEYSHIR